MPIEGGAPLPEYRQVQKPAAVNMLTISAHKGAVVTRSGGEGPLAPQQVVEDGALPQAAIGVVYMVCTARGPSQFIWHITHHTYCLPEATVTKKKQIRIGQDPQPTQSNLETCAYTSAEQAM